MIYDQLWVGRLPDLDNAESCGQLKGLWIAYSGADCSGVDRSGVKLALKFRVHFDLLH